MPKDLVVKDVEAALMKTRKCRRRPGDIPYPISYSNQMADFDIWDHMFLTSHFQNLTMHRFEQPPARSLDVGCGSGFWAIEAAKKWQNSEIIGFDIVKIQPRLHDIEYLRPLSQRIRWVHGNFLDGLPFPSNHFDFVRMAGLGLAIPEDEWQFVLEEIHRVMTPGAVLEIIEEDLLFPSPSALLQQPDQEASRSSPAVHIYIPPPHIPPLELFKSKSTNFYVRSSASPERSPISPATSTGSIHDHSKFANRISLFRPSVYVSGPSSSSTLTQPSPATTETTTETEHPQDHTRLKIAWEAMLATRFLSPKLLSVIPFYLTSSSFADTKSHSPLIIPLPPNSGTIPTLKSYRSMGSMREKENQRTVADPLYEFDFAPAVSTRSIKTDGCSFRTSTLPRPQAPTWGTMHLARTVSTITGCKEAIWAEYKQLYDKDALYLLSRTAPDEEDYSSQPHKHVVRKAFEVDWKNWEYDMLDRIAMRNNLLTHVPWVQATSKAERPDCQTWRETLNRKSGLEASSGHLVTGYNPDDLCRSLRVFTGFKS
ncbi:hypothetical protein BDZ97DRAFT_1915561 [Flammula alnicola]|nr:hypothetical protein BDZ97DRAFT_1915561 [Flammula alnicola]